MEKRGLGAILIIFVIVLLGVGLTVGTLILLGNSDTPPEPVSEGTENDDGETLPENEEEVTTEENNETEEVSLGCGDYVTQTACEGDPNDVVNASHPRWEELSCGDVEVECLCMWNADTSACAFGAQNITIELIVDLEAVSLDLNSSNCESGHNATCDMVIEGTLRNSGTETITEDFILHLLNTTDGTSLIELFVVSEDLSPGEEYSLSYTYEDLRKGDYFISLVVDAVSNVVEVDETNNRVTERLELF